MDLEGKVYIIYMAAGNSRRFQGNKLLHPIHGKQIYRYGLEVLLEVQRRHPEYTIVVIVQERSMYERLLQEEIPVVYNPDSSKGASYTIKAGIRALKNVKPEDYVMFVAADQPELSADTVERLAHTRCGTGEVAMVRCGERVGNPVMFSAALLPELMELTGDEGGRKVARRHKCTYVEALNERELDDIDYRNDLSSKC